MNSDKETDRKERDVRFEVCNFRDEKWLGEIEAANFKIRVTSGDDN